MYICIHTYIHIYIYIYQKKIRAVILYIYIYIYIYIYEKHCRVSIASYFSQAVFDDCEFFSCILEFLRNHDQEGQGCRIH